MRLDLLEQAGLAIGRGEESRQQPAANRGLDPWTVADSLVRSVPLGAGRDPSAWPELWERVGAQLDAFLEALERRSGASRLAARTRVELERRAVDAAAPLGAATVGRTRGVRVDLERPLPDLAAPDMERLLLWPEFAGRRLDTVELPVCDGVVPGAVVADAVAARHFWQLLGDWFGATTYPRRGLEGDHDRIGWVVFLQELWGLPDWPNERFYEVAEQRVGDRSRSSRLGAWRERGWAGLEVARDLPRLAIHGSIRDVVVTVGGTPLGVLRLAGPGEVDPDELRRLITTRGGLELCRHAVREGIVGRPLEAAGESLRARLAGRARERRSRRPRSRGFDLAPVERRPAVAAVGRHRAVPVGTSASRRAALPSAALAELEGSARSAREPLLAGGGRVEYVPELVWRSPDEPPAGLLESVPEDVVPPAGARRAHDRHRFEALFAAEEDPWDYAGAYEQRKYEQTLSLLPEGPIGRALELACAEGRFTEQLAPLVEQLTAADVSRVALRRAEARCAGLGNVGFLELDLVGDELPGDLDLIVCSEVLYYVGDRATLDAVAAKLARALKPGGHLVTLHGRVVQDEPGRPGFDWGVPFGSRTIGAALADAGGLVLTEELRASLYRVQRFQRPPAAPGPPTVTEIELPSEIGPSVLGAVRSDGAAGAVEGEPSTERLPILMYHRVAESGGDPRHRVTPEGFAQQLGYLRDAGFSSANPDEWRRAMEARRPLPGRRVMLTFDDGYADFATPAWPLLREHGFGALLFVVAGEVGGSNRWDGADAREQLLDWPELLRLRDEGVEIGAHSVSHPFMTTLSAAEVTREAARSRSILTEALGVPPLAFAYPYGDKNPAVQQLVGACGYAYAFSTQSRPSRYTDDLLDLPRIEIAGQDEVEQFVARLSASRAAGT